MRVLYYLFFPAGGIGKYSDRLLRELAADPSLDMEAATPPDYQWRDPPDYTAWPGLFRLSSPLALWRKARFLVAQWLSPWRLFRRAEQSNAQVIHLANINYLTFPIWRRALSRWGGRLVCTAHDVQRGRYILSRRWGERQLQRCYRACDAVFVHGEAQVQELVDFAVIGRERIHVVPHGPTEYDDPEAGAIDALRKHYGFGPDDEVALCFGFLRPEKNLSALLEAYARLDVPALRLLIVGNAAPGSSELIRQCRAFIEDQQLADRAQLDVRYVPDEEISALVSLAAWLVLPYKERFTSQSGVLHLAARYERPVLATPTAGFREALADEGIGLLCRGFGAEDLAHGMRRMLKHNSNNRAWDFAAFREAHSWRRNAELTSAVYQGLAGGIS